MTVQERRRPHEEAVLIADNVDEFVQRQRYQQIFDARSEAGRAIRESETRKLDAVQSGLDLPEAEAVMRQTVRKAVESYVLECEPLYQQTEVGTALWSDTDLATVRALECVAGASPDDVGQLSLLGTGGLAVQDHPLTIQVGGVGDYMAFNNLRARLSRTESLNRRSAATQTDDKQVTLSTPVWLSREAFRATNALLNDLGVGIEATSDDDGEVRGEYSDILEEDE